MIRANVAPGSPSLSIQLQAHAHPRVHSCRWAWCRLTFSINAELVHHVIHDHVRQVVPVMRKDIPMLKRAEEGIGESMSGFGTSYTDNAYLIYEDQPSSNPKSKQHASADVEPSSSLPSPPASSPPPFSPTSSDEEAGIFSEAPAPSPDRDAFHSPSPDMQQQSSPSLLSRPDASTESQPFLAQSPEGVYATPTFASLSSPAGSPVLPAVPGSPSFDSLVYEATSGKRKREDECFPLAKSLNSQWQNSQENSLSSSSSGSQDSVEKQLTQCMNVDAGYSQRRAQVAQLQTERLENYAVTSTLPQTDEISYKGELQWSAESSKMAPSNPRPSLTTSSLAPLQTQQHSPSTALVGALTTPTRDIHTPATSAQKQPWYGTLRSHTRGNRKSRQNSSFSVTDVHQSVAAAGIRPSKPSEHMPSPPGVHSSQDVNSRPSAQPGTPRPSGNVFQSGKLQITPTTLKSVQPEWSAADDTGSQSQSSIGWSQTQSQTSWLGHASYPPLQTQAPYQSQNNSSSQ